MIPGWFQILEATWGHCPPSWRKSVASCWLHRASKQDHWRSLMCHDCRILPRSKVAWVNLIPCRIYHGVNSPKVLDLARPHEVIQWWMVGGTVSFQPGICFGCHHLFRDDGLQLFSKKCAFYLLNWVARINAVYNCCWGGVAPFFVGLCSVQRIKNEERLEFSCQENRWGEGWALIEQMHGCIVSSFSTQLVYRNQLRELFWASRMVIERLVYPFLGKRRVSFIIPFAGMP